MKSSAGLGGSTSISVRGLRSKSCSQAIETPMSPSSLATSLSSATAATSTRRSTTTSGQLAKPWPNSPATRPSSHHRRALQVLELAGRLGGEQECAVLVDLLEASWWTGTSLKEQADRAIGLARATGDPRLFVRVVAAVPLFAEMGRVELEYLQEAAANIELADPGTAPRILDMLAHLMSNFPEFSEQECARAHERALESVRALQSPPELARAPLEPLEPPTALARRGSAAGPDRRDLSSRQRIRGWRTHRRRVGPSARKRAQERGHHTGAR